MSDIQKSDNLIQWQWNKWSNFYRVMDLIMENTKYNRQNRIRSWRYTFIHHKNETLTHLLKASLGTGILSMPFLINGIIMTIFTAFICTFIW
uniref:Amino acid transporter transmembrane domain-containing protein n=1 Tax=Megaselia scalaris TaxID=36166 RepID=T1H5F0_MEGSC